MPELPDIEGIKTQVEHEAMKSTIREVEVGSIRTFDRLKPEELREAIRGRKITAARRYGKYLFTQLDGGKWIAMHFGMSGSLKFLPAGEKSQFERMKLTLSDGRSVVYDARRMLGGIGITDDVGRFIREKKLGPDALLINFKDFNAILSESRGAVKFVLMDQSKLCGIGNTFSDEILFQAGIHPLMKTGDLSDSEIKKLFDTMKKVLTNAAEIYSNDGDLPKHFMAPHRYTDRICPKCGGKLEHFSFQARSGFFCPEDQPLP